MIKLWKFTVFTYVNADYTRYFVTKQAAEAAEEEARQKGNYTSGVKYAGLYKHEKIHVFGKDDCYAFPNYAKENEAFFD